MKPIWLLIPGMLNNEKVWQDVILGLKEKADIRVANVQTQNSIQDMANDCWALIRDVKPDVPVYVAGFSMGGYVAIEMVSKPAVKLHGLVLLSTSGAEETMESRAQREKTIHYLQSDFLKTLEGLVKWNTHEPSDDFLTLLKEMMHDVGAETAIRQIKAISNRTSHRHVLEKLQMPVKVLCGAHDRVIPIQRTNELASWIAGSQLEIIADAGHMLPMEQPQAVVNACLKLMGQ
jgi:pimeloyl-ACP methyl ester carboxylesterase